MLWCPDGANTGHEVDTLIPRSRKERWRAAFARGLLTLPDLQTAQAGWTSTWPGSWWVSVFLE